MYADDSDGDGDAADNCPVIANAAQNNNPCKDDNDNDGVPYESDNCPVDANPAQLDADSDGIGNVCEPPLNLSGTIKSGDDNDLCVMVLASGKFTFSCDSAGAFSVSGLPQEDNGTVKRQIYADGFFSTG